MQVKQHRQEKDDLRGRVLNSQAPVKRREAINPELVLSRNGAKPTASEEQSPEVAGKAGATLDQQQMRSHHSSDIGRGREVAVTSPATMVTQNKAGERLQEAEDLVCATPPSSSGTRTQRLVKALHTRVARMRPGQEDAIDGWLVHKRSRSLDKLLEMSKHCSQPWKLPP